MSKVVMYGRTNPPCPFCIKAKEVLDSRGIDYTYKDIVQPDTLIEFGELGVRTVPQLVLDGVNYGGFDKIQNLLTAIQEKEQKVEPEIIHVTKRDGTREPLDYEKINKVVIWASDGLAEVSPSQVAMRSRIQFYDGIPTKDIHETIVKTAADMISEETPEYAKLAARLAIFNIRKEAYGSYKPPHLETHISKLVEDGRYDKMLVEDYSGMEISELEQYIDHSRDLNFEYAAVKQLEGKYLVQNRVTGQIYESPQMIYMLVAMSLFVDEPKEVRLDLVKRYYDAVSLFKISLPTPIMGGVRTPTRQFSSCVLIQAGDSLDEINAASGSIVKYVSQRAGIGINAGMIRALGSEIRGGEAVHTGCIPFFKHFQTAVKSCSQGGLRGGAATLFYPLWHLEVENLLVLKNNRGVEENRVRHLDYGVQFNKLMYERLIKNQDITLFSPHEVEGMYDAYFNDQTLFEKLYTEAENNPNIRKKKVKAMELFSLFAQERSGTGRVYLQNVDHCNIYGPFKEEVATIYQSNLCLEIALPTKPLQHVQDPEGEVALCTLSAFNVGEIDNHDELEELAYIGVRALDNLLDFQDYPLIAAQIGSMNRRTLGFGIINFAYDLARRGLKYSDGSANNYTHELMESIQYFLMKASMEIAKEKGTCYAFNETKYSEGSMPVDRYKPEVDKLHTSELKRDWDWLREEIKQHGMRNSTLSALMPSETSSQVHNATNGIEPPRGLVSVKASKDGILKQVVPEIKRLGKAYELLWDIPSNDGYLQLVAIMQKFVDQTISANTNYDPSKFPNNKVPMKTILKDLLTAYKLGVKTLYYHNTRDGSGEGFAVKEEECEGGGCKI
ncbi:ribonucleotide-diphosphate reductase subunit alpha [Pseudoalteromonas phage J2-1_QLiu-2017]|nr:ribonucleotide-diphosphate reductase subunit alpha [Pseudoalteromonas phage J2-1_QLiu-2017]